MPAGNTYEAIATHTTVSAVSDFTFTSIPATYTDLVLVVNGYFSADDNLALQFNSDTGSNYSYTLLYGTGSSAVSSRGSSATSIYLGGLYTSSIGNGIYNIMNYSNNTTNKTVIGRTNAANGLVQARTGLWRNTSIISSIKVLAISGTFFTGSTLSLYGIKAA
jgi:hypothetical protein